MRKIRKVNTNKRKKKRKAAEERLATQASLMKNHPEECCVCGTDFTRTQETVITWRVIIREERVRLTCPSCWGKIQEVIEQCQE